MIDPMQKEPDGFVSWVREAVGIFRREQGLQDAIDGLLTWGFARRGPSLRDATTAGRTPEAPAVGPATPRTDHFRTEAPGNAEGSLMGGFAILPAFGAAGAGMLAIGGLTVISAAAGAVVGTVPAALLARHHAATLTGRLAEGGLLPRVRPGHRGRSSRRLTSWPVMPGRMSTRTALPHSRRAAVPSKIHRGEQRPCNCAT